MCFYIYAKDKPKVLMAHVCQSEFPNRRAGSIEDSINEVTYSHPSIPLIAIGILRSPTQGDVVAKSV